MTEPDLSPTLKTRFEKKLGQPITRIERLGRGYTPALHLRAWLRDGSTVFIKAATNTMIAEWLRAEADIYSRLRAPFMARFLGWEDGEDQADQLPFLLLEDLTPAIWPPPWTPQHIMHVRRMLDQLAECSLPGLLAEVDETWIFDGWQRVEDDPKPFLSLGMADAGWLDQALPVLLGVDWRTAAQGDRLVHGDVRSDNLCIRGEQAILVDWNMARRGNPLMDLGFWLPSLENEGGPPPEEIMPDGGSYAAIVSGYMAARAGLPVIPDAPRVRIVQYQQLTSALPWAVRTLGLPPLKINSLV